MKADWLNGIGVLLEDGGGILQGLRVGLVAHPASIDALGCPTATRLQALRGVELAALFSPEHGFFWNCGGGRPCGLHPAPLLEYSDSLPLR